MDEGIILVIIVGFALAAGGFAGWVWAQLGRAPTPYCTLRTPEAEAYRLARGLPPGAPIPRREYWRAVALGRITPEPWVKTPAEMAAAPSPPPSSSQT